MSQYDNEPVPTSQFSAMSPAGNVQGGGITRGQPRRWVNPRDPKCPYFVLKDPQSGRERLFNSVRKNDPVMGVKIIDWEVYCHEKLPNGEPGDGTLFSLPLNDAHEGGSTIGRKEKGQFGDGNIYLMKGDVHATPDHYWAMVEKRAVNKLARKRRIEAIDPVLAQEAAAKIYAKANAEMLSQIPAVAEALSRSAEAAAMAREAEAATREAAATVASANVRVTEAEDRASAAEKRAMEAEAALNARPKKGA